MWNEAGMQSYNRKSGKAAEEKMQNKAKIHVLAKSSGREKVAGRLTSKRKSGDTVTQIFKSDRDRCEGRSEGERGKVGTKKRPRRRRSARIDSGPKVAV